MPGTDALPFWWEWPDFTRVAVVLAAVAVAGVLGSLLRRRCRKGTKRSLSATPSKSGKKRIMSDLPGKHEEFPTRASDPVLRFLHRILRAATYVLALAMAIVILEGVASVIYTLYITMSRPPFFMVPDIVKTFGVFLAVLIAYEIFSNITLYLRTDVFPGEARNCHRNDGHCTKSHRAGHGRLQRHGPDGHCCHRIVFGHCLLAGYKGRYRRTRSARTLRVRVSYALKIANRHDL